MKHQLAIEITPAFTADKNISVSTGRVVPHEDLMAAHVVYYIKDGVAHTVQNRYGANFTAPVEQFNRWLKLQLRTAREAAALLSPPKHVHQRPSLSVAQYATKFIELRTAATNVSMVVAGVVTPVSVTHDARALRSLQKLAHNCAYMNGLCLVVKNGSTYLGIRVCKATSLAVQRALLGVATAAEVELPAPERCLVKVTKKSVWLMVPLGTDDDVERITNALVTVALYADLWRRLRGNR